MELDPSDFLTLEERFRFNERDHYLGKPCKRGHVDESGRTWRARNGYACVRCKREVALQWKRDHPTRHREATGRRDAKRSRRRAERQQTPFSLHAGSIRQRCRAKGIPFSIGGDDLKLLWREQGGICFWTGKQLDFFVGGAKHMFRPSVDRLEPSLGYVPGNIVWTTNFANRARGEAPPQEFADAMRSFGFSGPFEQRY